MAGYEVDALNKIKANRPEPPARMESISTKRWRAMQKRIIQMEQSQSKHRLYLQRCKEIVEFPVVKSRSMSGKQAKFMAEKYDEKKQPAVDTVMPKQNRWRRIRSQSVNEEREREGYLASIKMRYRIREEEKDYDEGGLVFSGFFVLALLALAWYHLNINLDPLQIQVKRGFGNNELTYSMFDEFGNKTLICHGSDAALYLRGIHCLAIPKTIPQCLRSPRPLRPPLQMKTSSSRHGIVRHRIWQHRHNDVYRNMKEFCEQEMDPNANVKYLLALDQDEVADKDDDVEFVVNG